MTLKWKKRSVKEYGETTTCVGCAGPLGYSIPDTAEFHKLCDACVELNYKIASYQPQTREEHEASIKVWGPTGDIVLRRRSL